MNVLTYYTAVTVLFLLKYILKLIEEIEYLGTADLRVGDYDNFVVVRNCGKLHDATNTTVFDG